MTPARECGPCSECCRALALAFYTLPYVFGVVAGHLFWNAPNRDRMNLKLTAWSVAGPLAVDASNISFTGGPIVFLFLGIFMGARYWPQVDQQLGTDESSTDTTTS